MATKQKIDHYLADLDRYISNYVFGHEDRPQVKELSASIIGDILSLLNAYGISVNQIYRDHPGIFKRVFTDSGPGDELRDILFQKGFDVNTRTITGETPLIQACNVGNEVVAQYLIKRGATIEAVHEGHTAPGLATANHMFNIETIVNDPDCKQFVEQYRILQNSMFLAHRWGINGSGDLGNDHFDKFTFSHPAVLRNSLCESFLSISRRNKAQLISVLKRADPDITEADFEQLIENIVARWRTAESPSVPELREKIANGETCPIAIGTRFADAGTHPEAIIFCNRNRLIRVNRGEGSDGRTGVEINVIENPENINSFLSVFDSGMEGIDANTLHSRLEEQLGLYKARLINMKEQTAPTSKWTSEKALFYGMMYAELGDFLRKKGLDAKATDDTVLGLVRPWYKDITKNDKLDMVQKTLDLYSGISIQDMPMMIKEILFKIYEKSKEREKYAPVVKLLEERNMKDYFEFNKQFIEALGKENEDTILSFIQGGVVGNQAVDGINSVLSTVIERGFKRAAVALLDNGTTPNPVPPAIVSSLNAAIELGDLTLVNLLLAKGAKASDLHLKSIENLRAKIAQQEITGSGLSSSGVSNVGGLSLTAYSTQLKTELARVSSVDNENISTAPSMSSSQNM